MFRENVLTQDDIIDRITSTMVPVAVDRWKVEDPRTREARFLQPFLRWIPAHGSPCIYSPEGKVLGGFHGYGDMAGRTRKLIDDALKAFGPVKPREARAHESHPYRGQGVMPDGGVCLAEYIRPSKQSLAFLNTKSPVVSSVTLSEKEFKTLAPPLAVVGTKWKLPDEVARRFSRVTSPLCRQHAPEPDWVTAVEINAEVRAITESTAWLRFDGQIASKHQVAGGTISVQATELTGEGVYELKTGAMRSVLMVGSGTLRWPEAPEKRVTFDVLVEWAREAPYRP